jgi:hypothetical protein
MEKSGVGAVTVRLKICVLATGAPDAFDARVTNTGPPTGVLTAALTVSVTVTGDDTVGFTEFEGEKKQVAPEGSPDGQLRVTAPEKLPEAVT